MGGEAGRPGRRVRNPRFAPLAGRDRGLRVRKSPRMRPAAAGPFSDRLLNRHFAKHARAARPGAPGGACATRDLRHSLAEIEGCACERASENAKRQFDSHPLHWGYSPNAPNSSWYRRPPDHSIDFNDSTMFTRASLGRMATATMKVNAMVMTNDNTKLTGSIERPNIMFTVSAASAM